ncbi:hypothetical protein [Chryseobacterium wanjuense]
MVSDATGVGTWQKTSGDADVTAASAGDVRNMADGTLRWTGAQITVPVTGYYIISPKVILDKLPAPSGSIQSCTGFVAYNLSKTPVAETDLAFTPDIHVPAGPVVQILFSTPILQNLMQDLIFCSYVMEVAPQHVHL